MANKQKKRLKRQMKKSFGQITKPIELQNEVKPWLNPALLDHIESKKVPVRADLYLGKYTIQNREYQTELNQVYGGTVQPVERFANYKSVILHHCSECSTDFYARPGWLLVRSGQKHLCGQAW